MSYTCSWWAGRACACVRFKSYLCCWPCCAAGSAPPSPPCQTCSGLWPGCAPLTLWAESWSHTSHRHRHTERATEYLNIIQQQPSCNDLNSLLLGILKRKRELYYFVFGVLPSSTFNCFPTLHSEHGEVEEMLIVWNLRREIEKSF